MPHLPLGHEVDQTAVEIDPSGLVQDLERRERLTSIVRRTLSVLPLPSMEVVYEDLAADASGFDRLLRFLAVEPAPEGLGSSLRKLNRAPREKLVTNYSAIEQALADTRFAGMLRKPGTETQNVSDRV